MERIVGARGGHRGLPHLRTAGVFGNSNAGASFPAPALVIVSDRGGLVLGRSLGLFGLMAVIVIVVMVVIMIMAVGRVSAARRVRQAQAAAHAEARALFAFTRLPAVQRRALAIGRDLEDPVAELLLVEVVAQDVAEVIAVVDLAHPLRAGDRFFVRLVRVQVRAGD